MSQLLQKPKQPNSTENKQPDTVLSVSLAGYFVGFGTNGTNGTNETNNQRITE